MPKYVPGPYKIAGAGENVFSEIISLEIVGADDFPVAELPMTAILPDYDTRVGVNHWAEAPGKAYIERDPEEVLATAQLFEAAPELLEAAKKMLIAIDILGTQYGVDHGGHEFMKPFINTLEAAIAKAGGKE